MKGSLAPHKFCKSAMNQTTATWIVQPLVRDDCDFDPVAEHTSIAAQGFYRGVGTVRAFQAGLPMSCSFACPFIRPQMRSRSTRLGSCLTWKGRVRRQDDFLAGPTQFGIEELQEASITKKRPRKGRVNEPDDGLPLARL